MTLDEAITINAQIVKASLSRHMADGSSLFLYLPQCSLSDMLEAARLVRQSNTESAGVKRTSVSDRGIAAIYACEQFGGPHELLGVLGYVLEEDD